MQKAPLAVTLSLLSLLTVDAAILLQSGVANAQVSSDGTLSTRVTANGTNFVIEDGDRAGNNLFHSFREFSIPTGGSAIFNNAADIQNIFSRVTGGNISNIDGLIQANGTANLFLLNPSGIIFGANASLNIGGSFVGTTADRLQFSDGTEFSATNTTGISLLTVSTPVGLQMGQNPGTITVNNTGHRLSGGPASPLNRSKNPVGLRVTSGHTLALIGGELRLQGGVLTAPSGNIELGSVSTGNVTFNPSLSAWSFNYNNAEQLGDIRFSDQALADASGSPGGSIHIQGRTISLNDSSVVLLSSQGNQDSGAITVDASERLESQGIGRYGFLQSFLRTDNVGSGAGGDLVVTVPQIWLQDGARITTRAFGSGAGGNISVEAADSIQLFGIAIDPSNSTGIAAISNSPGRGGDVQVSTGRLRLQNGAVVLSSSRGTGPGGNSTVNVSEQIEVIGDNVINSSGIIVASLNRGDGGDLTINTPRLRLQDGGAVITSTLGTANSGTLRLNVSDEIVVSGRGAASGLPSRIGSRAELLPLIFQQALQLPAFPAGNPGNLIINTARLRITDGAIVGVDHQGNGSAGDLRLNADTVSLDRTGSLTASTRSGGGGNMNLRANTLTLQRGSSIVAIAAGTGNGGQVAIAADILNLLSNSYISTQAQGAGNAGTLNLRVDQLNLNRGRISVESEGSGNAGYLTINADAVQLNHRSVINATTQVGRGGNLRLRVSDTIQLNDRSRIVADAEQSGFGGNIRITANEAVLQNSSLISTNAQGIARGGTLSLESDRLSLLSGSQITASTAGSGRAGSLNVVTYDGINLSGRRSRLTATSSTDAPAGSILLRSPEVTVSDRASISVSGQGQGGAGNLSIQANRINLESGTLEARVAGGDRGNISLNANLLSLRQNSQITTNATGTASGGNINLNTDFVIGLENSDIVARAEQGTGGNIAIATEGLIGIEPRAELTAESDINASSQLGLNGSINVTTPNVDPDSGLVELPETLVDSSQQVAQACASSQENRFVATGRGGVPVSPDEALSGDRAWSDLRELDLSTIHASNELVEPVEPVEPVEQAVRSSASTFTEATALQVNGTGQLELVVIETASPIHNQVTCLGNRS